MLLSDVPTPSTCAAPREPAPTTSSAAITSYFNTSVTVQVVSVGCGYLVLNDVWQRWWSVEVNGQFEPLLKANVLFRAVQVPAGASTIIFRFEPFRGLADDLMRRMPRGIVRSIEAGLYSLVQMLIGR